MPLAAKVLKKVMVNIRIGDLPIIRDSEIQNFCLHGTVGAGKSEVIRRLANYARQRGDMVVIYDRSGEFVKSYYDPSIDKILNPLDARCAAWDLWKECLTQPDFDNTANTLIPMGTKEDPFWQGSGRTIFAEAAYLMRNDPNRSWPGLFDGDTPRLLACGIRDVLLEDVAQRNIPLSHKKLRRALKAITRSESYLCAMKAGACRYDTEGYVTEHISQEEEAYAAERLDKIRRQNRIKAELQAVLDEK